jgi:hypothetical protein
VKIKRRRGRACSPPQQRVGDGLGAGEAAVAEIDADCRASVPARVARFGGGRRGPGARDPLAGDTCGDGRRNEFEEVVAGDEERRMAGNGAATGFPGSGACGDEGKVREVWMSAKEQPQVLVLHLYRARREERGSRLDVLAINDHGGLRPSMPSRGGS